MTETHIVRQTPPRISSDTVHAALRAALGRKVTSGDPEKMSAYLADQCLLTTAGVPAHLVRATAQEDVVETLKVAHRFQIPVVTRGAGTGLTGAANAIDGCIMLSLADMNRIVEIDPVGRLARVEPGVINGDLDRAASGHGLGYLPDPGSRDISTIGGNIATNAGGMCCVKYGVTREHVAALTVVLSDGQVLRTGSRTRKNVTGLDLTSLVVGSEGTLAVITEATVWLHPRPVGTSTVVALFGSLRQAVIAVDILTRTLAPSAVEIMDSQTIAAVNEFTRMGINTTAAAVLLLRFDGSETANSTDAELAGDLLGNHGASEVFRTNDPAEGNELMAARAVALTALESKGAILLHDVAVPVHQLPALVAGVGQIAERHELTIATFGHAADGNMHPTIVFDAADSHARHRAKTAFEEVMDLGLSLGGVLSGEHGIGVLKQQHLPKQLDPGTRNLTKRVKHAFDPMNLLNPGRAL
ncbi:D-lactate dehydrogenase (cytochrome)/glycolate oxidase [Kribbella sp. VKM Ac-2569]|uniref:FAD-binding oxidoreductase n=1 Tax=Kribbella sp. VKM Ac-2569 TaxID=2512220 RepID=UPI00102D1FA3|nr:FAD-linked oxidase C-terminal domain-containing protein [Kribbella sp. VKM Ac-2569]RZT28533.1 D-lactate dehydrogenase (cytochrome)/glycolate oxidase [Kribbella sp. VKM Ac-2569]